MISKSLGRSDANFKAKRSLKFSFSRPDHDLGLGFGLLFRVAVGLASITTASIIATIVAAFNDWQLGSGALALYGCFILLTVALGEHYRHLIFEQSSGSESEAVSIEINTDTVLVNGSAVLNLTPKSQRKLGAIYKRFLDVAISSVALIFLLPMLIAVSVILFLSSRGPILYRGVRYDVHRKKFYVLKFRTTDAGGKRVTRIGYFIRRTSIDELPQLWNVLTGEMSLVGPRPYLRAEDAPDDFSVESPGTKPGITGLAQSVGIRGTAPGAHDKRRLLDAAYTHHWSFWLDLQIIGRTIRAEFFGRD